MADTDNAAVRRFREKCEAALAEIKTSDEFRSSDTMVEMVMKAGEWLTETPLDQMTPDTLLRTGGKLVGAYPYLGQMSARARAERDIYEQKADETEKERISEILKTDPKYKVTQAKSDVAAEMSVLKDFVVQKDATKNQWEAITNACQMMVMFVQTSLRIKENERYAGKRMHDQG